LTEEVLIDVDLREFLWIVYESEQTDGAWFDAENILEAFGRGKAKAFDSESLSKLFQIELLVLGEAD